MSFLNSKNYDEVNGCGVRLGWLGVIKPPHHKFFNTQCELHDELYNLGGDEQDRKRADKRLFDDMLRHSIEYYSESAFKQWRYVSIALAYYFAVRLFGRRYFNYK